MGGWPGGWAGGVSALPRAQGWCGWTLGSSGTWLALEFYCEPARAWHSHENGYGRTEGRKERMKESRGRQQRGGKQDEVGGRRMVKVAVKGSAICCCCGFLFGFFAGGAVLKVSGSFREGE